MDALKREKKPRGRHQQILRHPTVMAQARAVRNAHRLLAVLLKVGAAISTSPASPDAIDQHRIARTQTGDAGAELFNPSGVFVP
jgi:hypothetical protein